MVEGSPRPTRCNDHLNYAFEIAQHVAGRDAQDAELQFSYPRVTGRILLCLMRMNFAVDFDVEPRLYASEVEAVAIERMLAAEF